MIAISFINGVALRKEKVTPNGIPDSINPRNGRMAEHEQNGVTIPSDGAIIFPVKSDLPSNALCLRSGENQVRIIPTKKMMMTSNIHTLRTSKRKKRTVGKMCSGG